MVPPLLNPGHNCHLILFNAILILYRYLSITVMVPNEEGEIRINLYHAPLTINFFDFNFLKLRFQLESIVSSTSVWMNEMYV